MTEMGKFIGKHPKDGNLAFTHRPVFQKFEFEVSRIDQITSKRPIDHRKIAKEIAEYLLANGFINQHEPLRHPDRDSIVLRFSLMAAKAESPLP